MVWPEALTETGGVWRPGALAMIHGLLRERGGNLTLSCETAFNLDAPDPDEPDPEDQQPEDQQPEDQQPDEDDDAGFTYPGMATGTRADHAAVPAPRAQPKTKGRTARPQPR